MWGKVVLYLKEKKYIALQIACGDILDVSIIGNNFVINTQEQLIFELLMQNENQKIIKKALEWQGFLGNLEINRLLKAEDIIKSDLERLRQIGIEFLIKKGVSDE
ncbi:MAG: hypothetical protein PHQ62_00370 [Clostridia bacterium]|nr:hypothetical protein [Clostridia bacterium]